MSTTLNDPGFPTLPEVMKSLAPDGSVEMQLVNTLIKKNSAIQDIPFIEANQSTGHMITSVTGLPSPTWRAANNGIDPTKGILAQYIEAFGSLDDRSVVDVKVAARTGNPAAYRAQQDRLKLEAYRQEVARAIFYEDITLHPERMHGLQARYAATTGYTSSGYVYGRGTRSGSNCESVWCITWDPDKVFGFYPKGSKAGLSQEDKGAELVVGANGKQMRAWVTEFSWEVGLGVGDYRYCSRAQWDPDDTATYPDTGKQFYIDLDQQLGSLFEVTKNTRIYMSRTSLNKLSAQLAANDANYLQYLDAGGQRLPHFQGVPIRVDDALVGESAIS